MLHEAGHPEPRIIAMSEAPSTYRAPGCAMRWGIGAMFSGFKTRGLRRRRFCFQRLIPPPDPMGRVET
jgi:hypothetical protein